MRFSFWLRNWKRSAPAARRRTQTSPRQRASFRPRLEALEDRLTPSGGGPGHGGGGSGGGSGGGLPYATAGSVNQLIADINYANTAGGTITINLKPGTTFDLKQEDNTTNGGNELPVIGGTNAIDLTINGNGAAIERVASINHFGVDTNHFRLLDVAQGASLTLEDVTLKGGWAFGSGAAGGDGGAIYNQGTLKVSNGSTFSGSFADYGGGGIYNAGGTVAISDSILSGNFAHYGGSGGGGIYNAGGTVAISHSTLSGNTAHYGAGIDNVGGTVTVSNNSTLSGNHAEYVTPGYDSASGPGIGGGVYNSGGTVVISHSTLSDNAADDFGGGIYNAGGTVKVSNSSTLSGNSASYGGGIYNYAGTLTLSNSILSGNSAFDGGGIYINGGTVSVSGCTLTGNSAKTESYYTTSGSFVTYGGMGGGIYNVAGTLTIHNSVFQNNSPDNIDGTYSGSGNTGLP